MCRTLHLTANTPATLRFAQIAPFGRNFGYSRDVEAKLPPGEGRERGEMEEGAE